MGRGGAQRLFAYGTLMVPAVFEAVCGPAARSRPALLHGYARYRVRGHAFPGIVPAPGTVTDGVLLEPVDDAMWSLLDAFESDFYVRERVTVELTPEPPRPRSAASGSSQGVSEPGERIDARTYVVRPGHRGALTRQAWDAGTFVARHLPAYLARYT